MIVIEIFTSSKAELCSLMTPSKLQRPRKEYGSVLVVLFDMAICSKVSGLVYLFITRQCQKLREAD